MILFVLSHQYDYKAERGEGGTDGEILSEGSKVCSEETDTTDVRSQSMQYRKSNRHPIVRRSPSPQLIQNNQRFRRSLKYPRLPSVDVE